MKSFQKFMMAMRMAKIRTKRRLLIQHCLKVQMRRCQRNCMGLSRYAYLFSGYSTILTYIDC